MSVSISGQVDTGLLSYSPRLYLTAGMPSLEQRSDAMSSVDRFLSGTSGF